MKTKTISLDKAIDILAASIAVYVNDMSVTFPAVPFCTNASG